ncbi:ROK family glucokinase [Streptomonospora nanhaiensis]|uniref:Glucokinase n=1 Tax=Streptomonospora nanhaiensis TaxID=1323731 RepID=A0A853BK85_9ACTN|nr:ROK family glucokinase [Streptomonospora nanhaiensis]MBV2362407.1 ROK family glucokinase [Streptomonospora nanhaiensis]MBX9389124.1 ROK family glucokinase [Streptomonospora nanhaiensis]NYI94936.1 glucokinase [Streptomonospora nanhaiensis]
MRTTIGVDIGGTKVAAGVVDPQGRVHDVVKHPTPFADAEALADVVGAAVRELRERNAGADIAAVGIGTAGFVDADRATIVLAANLGLADDPFKERLQRRVDLPVVVENDANAAAWAEARFGAGRGSGHVVCVTLGTGVGGGVVMNGEIQRGGFGAAAEFGHYRVVPYGRRCGCGNHGCWEQYASGRALVGEAHDLARTDPERAARLVELAGGDIAAVQGGDITRAAVEGDPGALACFRAVGEWVGLGLADLAAILDPELFVIGGGVSDAGDILLGPVRDSFQRNVSGRATRRLAGIRVASMGSAAGIVGAADLALR